MGEIRLLIGEPGSDKTGAALSRAWEALDQSRREGSFGTVLWLTPTQTSQKIVLQRLLARQTAVLAPQVWTFEVFAEHVLRMARETTSVISPVLRRVLLRQIIEELLQAGELPFFAGIGRTPGFLDVLTHFIDDCKRAEIWPEEFSDWQAAQTGSSRQRDRELARLYSLYQERLHEHNWYDHPGRFWLARTRFAELNPTLFQKWQLVVVDGFVDFTPTQYEILAQLAAVVPELWITLPHPGAQPDNLLGREDVFGRPKAASGALGVAVREVEKNLGISIPLRFQTCFAERHTWQPGLRTLAEGLFSNPRVWDEREDARGLEIVAAIGREGERNFIAARLKSLLQTGVRPQHLAVVVRSTGPEMQIWEKSLRRAGIPIWSAAEDELRTRPVIKAILAILQCELNDWPFESVMRALDFDFRPSEKKRGLPSRSRHVARALRQLHLHRNRLAILQGASRWAERQGEEHVTSQEAHATLQMLDEALAPLRKRLTLGEWSNCLVALVKKLVPLGPAALKTPDQRDFDLLQRLLRDAAAAEQRISQGAVTRRDLSEFVRLFRDLVRAETVGRGSRPAGTVLLVDVEEARHLEPEYLFLTGMTEDSFPRRDADNCLFGEGDRQSLRQSGLPFPHPQDRQQSELFLFYQLVTRPRKGLVLSYPSVNPKGQPLFPSPFVQAIRRLFQEDALPIREEGQLNPVPAHGDEISVDDVRLSAVQQARDGNPAVWRRFLEEPAARDTAINLLAAAEVAAKRFHTRGFSEHEGRLDHPVHLRTLARDFGPKHQFSATELEAFAQCPFRYWVSSILKIQASGDVEHGTDYAARGQMVHEVLRRLLSEESKEEAEIASRFLGFVTDLLGRKPVESELQRALHVVEERLLGDWAAAYAQQDGAYSDLLAETSYLSHRSLTEIPFGSPPQREDEVDAGESDEPTVPPLEIGSREAPVLVRGRIDRVDIFSASGETRFNIIDYKSSKRPSATLDALKTGRALQLALYATAVRRLKLVSPDAEPLQVGYWVVGESGFSRSFTRVQKMAPLAPEIVLQLEEALDELIPLLVERMRRGEFVVENADPQCASLCDYKTVCRVAQVRAVSEKLAKRTLLTSAPAGEPETT